MLEKTATKTWNKVSRELAPGLYPTPVVLVTCVDDSGRPNIITLAWAGVVCSEPPHLGLGVRPSRYSYALMEKRGQFVVNIPSADLVQAVDICGTVSGRDQDKFALTGLTPLPATKVSAPLIAECPVNLECILRHKIPLGSHHLFIGEVVASHASSQVLDGQGRVDFTKAGPITYCHRQYWGLGPFLGNQGLSVKRR